MATLTPFMPVNALPGQAYWHPNGYYAYWPVAPTQFTTTPVLVNPMLAANTPVVSVHTPLPSHAPSVQCFSYSPYPSRQCTPQPPAPPPCPIHVCLQPNGSELGLPVLEWNLNHNPASAMSSGKQITMDLLKEFAIPTNGGDVELEIIIKDAGATRFAAVWEPVKVRRNKGTRGPFTIKDVLLSIADYLHTPLTWERAELTAPEKVMLMKKRGMWLADPEHFWPNDSTPWSLPRRVDLLQARNFGGLTVRKATEKGWQFIMTTM